MNDHRKSLSADLEWLLERGAVHIYRNQRVQYIIDFYGDDFFEVTATGLGLEEAIDNCCREVWSIIR